MKLASLAQTLVTTVSHNARIRKQALFADGELPPLTNFSQATFPPGEIAYAHAHADMLEVFLIQSGSAVMTVDGVEYALLPGGCIAVEPGETHELRNASATDPLVVTYFGIQLPANAQRGAS
ncbi:cupin domain-containing protein [Candidatus Thiothrix sp. Deng01]|uniref:Cupin domain-containing protein n=1 Tax=Candidatus Thiothrix phosphatis TaxID=3112415 RepID=A0ABU6D3Q3_9GAMM|nr:cupin domain-containing protein [Candidatus Thiothrix sp. Deng01]MEB4593436.1 cupin domain-containing protein [Candidatus Thiothrix sp. Deng01]